MADNNDDCLSVNSDFERIPNTPMGREENDDFDLDEGQKTPKGFAASESGDQSKKPESIDPVVAALMKKVDMLAVKVDGLSKDNLELRTHLVDFKHYKEHEDAEFELIDNSKGAMWDTSISQLYVQTFTVKNENRGVSIRSTKGFSTVPLFTDSLIYNVNNYEVTIDEIFSAGTVHLGFATSDFTMGEWVGKSHHSLGITNGGTFWKLDKETSNFTPGGFSVGDTVGLMIAVGSKTATAEAVNCKRCLEKPSWLLFAKNGKIWGSPIPLPSELPSTFFPTISLSVGCKVTANFGNKPFKYDPSAVCSSYAGAGFCHYEQLNNELEKMRAQQIKIEVEANTNLAVLRAQIAEQKAEFQSKLDAIESKANTNVADLRAQMAKQQADFESKMAKQQATKLDVLQSKQDGELEGVRTENIIFTLATHHGQLGMLTHLKPKFVELIKNNDNVAWNLVDNNSFIVSGNSVTRSSYSSYRSIRSKRGFSVSSGFNPFKVHFLVLHYFEITIDKRENCIHVGLASEDIPVNKFVGGCANSFGIYCGGAFYQSGTRKDNFGPGGFTQGDTIGCGLMVVSESTQSHRWIFFTKNGKIWGTSVELPSNVPSILYPTVSIYAKGDKVTANFGIESFKYAIPPAEGLLC